MTMEITARTKYTRITPRKVKIVIEMVRGKRVEDALNILDVTRKAASRIVGKLVRSAVANASRRGDIDVDTLFIKGITVGPGPTLKRFRPAPMGRATPVKKRTSHISVILGEK